MKFFTDRGVQSKKFGDHCSSDFLAHLQETWKNLCQLWLVKIATNHRNIFSMLWTQVISWQLQNLWHGRKIDDDHCSRWSKCILYDCFPAFLHLQVLLLRGIACTIFNAISNRLHVAKMPKLTAWSAFSRSLVLDTITYKHQQWNDTVFGSSLKLTLKGTVHAIAEALAVVGCRWRSSWGHWWRWAAILWVALTTNFSLVCLPKEIGLMQLLHLSVCLILFLLSTTFPVADQQTQKCEPSLTEE